MTDFDQWAKNMGIDPDKQYSNQQPLLMLLEALYDLIIDTRKRLD
jgi:hypothetical protein